MRLKKRCVHELPISEMVNSGTVRLKEDISFEKRRHPRRRQLRRLFPVCITVLWVLVSYTDRQLLQYTYSRKISYTDKEKASQMCCGSGAGAGEIEII